MARVDMTTGMVTTGMVTTGMITTVTITGTIIRRCPYGCEALPRRLGRHELNIPSAAHISPAALHPPAQRVDKRCILCDWRAGRLIRDIKTAQK